ncbi:hypothetical protein MtrunA17_Chr8g0351711 [Medicago truncatula]|uniref:Transmembrane protein, putative n=1 Tax=Medicago truncatula TaxID=3880 RepID=A0A072TPA9_MEDTR|nr:transmembrane protein, putative [Medicago truncatula]RHN40156.1 hypothetical protein MtrunA17_Chr8g0351711 [Medicago truncatula]
MIEVFLFLFNCSGPQTESESSTVDIIFRCLYPSESSLHHKLMRDKLLLIRALTLWLTFLWIFFQVSIASPLLLMLSYDCKVLLFQNQNLTLRVRI